MHKIKLYVFTALIGLLCFFTIACNQVIEFDYNIDFVVDGNIVATVGTNGDKISMPPNPAKEDFTFDGWYWDEGNWINKFTLNSILNQPLQEKNHYKVYAKFKSSIYYTVIFDNGKEEIKQQIKQGVRTALRLNTFSSPHNNYVFSGWNTSDDTLFADGEEILNICPVGETIHLYPKWEYVEPPVDYGSYTIVFNANGGNGSMPNQTIGTTDSVSLSANTFTREYYDFLGWSYHQEGDEVDFTDKETVKTIASIGQIVTLYARWKTCENVYLINKPIDLLSIRENSNGIYVLQNDLNCIELSLPPLATVDAPFNGIFDGNGFSIKSISLVGSITESNKTSLFGYIGKKGIIKDLSIMHANTVSNVFEAAIFATVNHGKIENCYALGCTVEVNDRNENTVVKNAGLVLENYGIIKNCYFRGDIMSSVNIGEHGGSAGICLTNTGTIENCLLIQTMIAVINDRNTYGQIDALVGQNNGHVQNCYYDTDSFFNVIRYTYKEDDNTLTRFPLFSSFGSSVKTMQLNNSSFYIDTLNWDEDIWNLSDLNITNEKHPKLKT